MTQAQKDALEVVAGIIDAGDVITGKNVVKLILGILNVNESNLLLTPNTGSTQIGAPIIPNTPQVEPEILKVWCGDPVKTTTTVTGGKTNIPIAGDVTTSIDFNREYVQSTTADTNVVQERCYENK